MERIATGRGPSSGANREGVPRRAAGRCGLRAGHPGQTAIPCPREGVTAKAVDSDPENVGEERMGLLMSPGQSVSLRKGRRARSLAALAALSTGVAAVLVAATTGGAASTATSTTTVRPVADAYVESTATSTNFGTSTRIVTDASPVRQIFLRFDLRGVAGPLQQARLRLHVANTTDAPSPSGGTVATATDNGWTETGLTYANRPTSFGPTAATIGAVARNTWVEVPVTQAITLGLTVTLAIRSTNNDGAFYDSRESGANAPQLILTTGVATPPPPATTAVEAACTGQLVATNAGPIAGTALTEISGIDAGIVNPSLWWTHNDSGDSARVFAITAAGATQAIYTLTGASAVDWEDIALGGGPVAGRPYLYLADIGDNARARSEIVVYRVAEPTVSASGTFALAGVEALRLRYPDGAHNAEALVVDQVTGEIVIFEKTSAGGTARVYRAPAGLAAGSLTTMTQVAILSLPTGSTNLVTGADLSADGSQLAVRTYAAVLLWSRAAGAPIWAPLASSPCSGPLPAEVQGEAIAFRPDGRGYVTVSEGVNQVLHGYAVP